MGHSSLPGGLRLTRSFAIGALIVTAAAAVGSVLFNSSLASRRLHDSAGRHEAAVAQAMATLPWPRFAYFVRSAGRLEPGQVRAFWQTEDLLRDMPDLLAGTRVLRIRLHDARGVTVFSSDTAEIGRVGYVDPDLRTALGGESAGGLSFVERFEAARGTVSDRWILTSYVPLRADGPSGAVEGVVELHSDVTDLEDRVGAVQRATVGPTLATFALVFGLLLALVWTTERRLLRARGEGADDPADPAGGRSAARPKLELVGHLSHEIRTPLNTILGFAESIKDGLFGPVGNPRYIEYSTDIYNSGRQVLKIIDDALELADLEAGRLQARLDTLDPLEAARDVIALLGTQADSAGVELRLEVAGAPGPIVSDRERFRQILVNLLSNALAHTPPGGSVTIAMEQRERSGTVRVAVRDTGIGMKREEVPIALTPFRRIDLSLGGKRRGTGLGLPMSRRLVELLGGELEVETELGIGTTVSFTLPDRAATLPDCREATAA